MSFMARDGREDIGQSWEKRKGQAILSKSLQAKKDMERNQGQTAQKNNGFKHIEPTRASGFAQLV